VIEFATRDAEQTRELGKAIAGKLEAGDTLAFKGELGSGKTTLIQGIIKGLGITDRVQSPSFILIRTYQGGFEIKHVDLYRLNSAAVDSLHLEEIHNQEGVMLVEWAGRADWLPGRVSSVEIAFDPGDPQSRSITVTGPMEKRLK